MCEGVIGAKVSKRVAYCSAAQDLLSGSFLREIFFGGALRVLTRFSRKSHPRRIDPTPPHPRRTRCRTPVATSVSERSREGPQGRPAECSFLAQEVLFLHNLFASIRLGGPAPCWPSSRIFLRPTFSSVPAGRPKPVRRDHQNARTLG